MRANTRKPLPRQTIEAEAPPKRGRGRPPHVHTIDGEVVRLHRQRYAPYDEATASEILDQLASGKTLRSICREPGMPTATNVNRWATDDVNGFADRLERARKLQGRALFDETIDISNQECIDLTEVNAAKLKIDTRFRYLAKLYPREYGDKIEVTSKTETLSDEQVDAQLQSLIETADRTALLKQPATRKLLAKPR